MSVSGIGGSSNDLYALWAEIKARAAASAQATPTTPAASTLGTAVQPGTTPLAGIQSVTAASGSMPMNAADSSSFQASMSAVGSALQSGDLGAAQSAFKQATTTLASSGVHGHHHHHGGGAKKAADDSSSAGASSSPFGQALDALGQSLQNGDLAGAQSAFAQLNTLLETSTNKLTSVPIGANSPANPMGGALDVTA